MCVQSGEQKSGNERGSHLLLPHYRPTMHFFKDFVKKCKSWLVLPIIQNYFFLNSNNLVQYQYDVIFQLKHDYFNSIDFIQNMLKVSITMILVVFSY